MSLYNQKYRIETCRLKNWDYGSNGKYFITICTKYHISYFGKIVNGQMKLSKLGKMAYKCWEEIPKHFPFVHLDAYVIMPNHVHGIISIEKNDCGDLNLNGDVLSRRNAKFCVSTDCSINRFGPQSKNIGSIIRGYKIGVTKFAKNNNILFTWQPRFYDHFIRTEDDLYRIRNYIANNPLKWKNDKFYISL